MQTRPALRLLCIAVLTVLAGCELDAPRPAESVAPAPLGGVLRISSAEQKSIGIAVEPAVVSEGRDTLTATGWVMVKPGNEVIVKAPVAGFVVPTNPNRPIEAGMLVARGDTMASVEVVLSPSEQAQLIAAKEEAETVIRQSQASMDLAEVQLIRLQGNKDAVAITRMESLRETYDRCKAALEEARDRLPYLPTESADKSFGLKPVAIPSPLAGVVVTTHVRPRQFVLQGEPLWTLEDRSTYWVRVPVFDADLDRVRREDGAEMLAPGGRQPMTARSVAVPLSTRPGERTVDLMYEISGAGGILRPGQTLTAWLPTSKPAKRIEIPHSAVLWDGFGNAWVYASIGAEQFRRQKIEIGAYLPGGKGVVVQRGLQTGDRIVTVGAQALYGEEFKADIQVEEEEGESERERERERGRR